MKLQRIVTSLLICVTAIFSSCGNESTNHAKSVHVDSTNENGTAPVQYGAANPADTTSDLQSSDDTGRRSNTNVK